MIPNSSLIVSATEPQGRNRKKVWFRKGKNLFNKDNATESIYLETDGTTGASSVSNTSEYIKIEKGTLILSYDYTELASQGARGYCFYDNNKSFLSGGTYNNANKVNELIASTDGYLRFSYDKNATNVQLVQEYNQIYVRNSNGVYEEFIKKHEEIYSTEEQVIGKWIDGRALYRKVVDCGTMPNATSKTISTGLSNVSYKKMEGMITNGTLYYEMNNTRPTDTNTINTIGLYINNNNIIIESKIDRSSYTGYVILEYTKNN